MEVGVLIELISAVGFPIACVIAMGAFIFIIYKNMTKENKENMAQVQARCQAREEKLYTEIKENREINAKAIQTISSYAEKLETIQQDVKVIKNDLTVLMVKDDI